MTGMGLLGVSDRAVGLELDAGEARAVELRGRANAPTLAAWGRVALPAGAVVDGAVAQPETVGRALADLWVSAGIGAREVVLGVVNQDVLVRFAILPKVPRDKLPNVIRYQAPEYLPVALDTVVWDFAVIGEKPGTGPPFLEVLLVAARREMVDGFLAALAAARLTPRDIDVASLALLRLLPSRGEKASAVMLLHLADYLSTVLIVAGGVPRLARIVSVGLSELCGTTGHGVPMFTDHRPAEVLRSWVGSLEAEIRSLVGYYQAQPGAKAVETVILSGRGARVPGLLRMLEENLGVGVMILDPLKGLKPRGPGVKIEPAVDFAVGIGLARRGLEG